MITLRLSPHFTIAEATKSAQALRLGIDNTPNDEHMKSMRATAVTILEPVRAHYGVPIIPSSWFRCETLERVVCWNGNGVTSAFANWCRRHGKAVDEISWQEYFERKQHCKGEAVDFEVAGVPNLDLAKWVSRNCEFDQIILEYYNEADPNSGWVHCSHRADGQNRKQALTFDGKSYTFGLPVEKGT